MRHGECNLELIPLESEHLLFDLSVCEVLRSFDVPAHRSFGVPSKYGRWSRWCDTARRLGAISSLCWPVCQGGLLTCWKACLQLPDTEAEIPDLNSIEPGSREGFDAMCVEIGVTFLIQKVVDLAEFWQDQCISVGLPMLQIAASLGHRHMTMGDNV